MRKIKDGVFHCTATKEGVFVDAKDIDQWHKKRGWSGIGYHLVVLLDGTVEVGRPVEKQGAHVKGHNRNSIGVVYVGGLDKNMVPKDTRTPEQKKSLECIAENLLLTYPGITLKGHRDYSEDKNKNGVIEPFEWIKVCPCYDVESEYKELCNRIKNS